MDRNKLDRLFNKFKTDARGEDVRSDFVEVVKELLDFYYSADVKIDKTVGEWLKNNPQTFIDWLNEHPEAVSTVVDGSLTFVKFAKDNGFGFVIPDTYNPSYPTDNRKLDEALHEALENEYERVLLLKREYTGINNIHLDPQIPNRRKLHILGNGATIKIASQKNNFFYTNHELDIIIEDVNFVGAGNTSSSYEGYPSLIEMTNGGTLEIRNCHFSNVRHPWPNDGYDHAINHNSDEYDDRRGYLVTGIGLDGFIFEHNEIHDCGGEEIMWISPSENVNQTDIHFNGNYIHDITGWTFNLFGKNIECKNNRVDNYVQNSTIFNFCCDTAVVSDNIITNTNCLDAFDFSEQGIIYGMDVLVERNNASLEGGGFVRLHGETAVIRGNTVSGSWFVNDHKAKTPISSVLTHPESMIKKDWVVSKEVIIKDNRFVFKRTFDVGAVDQNTGYTKTDLYPFEYPIRIGYVANFVQPIDYMTDPLDYETSDPTSLVKESILYSDTFTDVEASALKQQDINVARLNIPVVSKVDISGNTFDMTEDSISINRSNEMMFSISETEDLNISDNTIIGPRLDDGVSASYHFLMLLYPYKNGFNCLKFNKNLVRYRNDGAGAREIFYTQYLSYSNSHPGQYDPNYFVKDFYIEDNVWETYTGAKETVYLGMLSTYVVDGNTFPVNKILNLKFTSDILRVGGNEYAYCVGRAVRERPMQCGTVSTRDSLGRFEVDFYPPFINKPVVVGTISDNAEVSPATAVRLVGIGQDEISGLYTYALFKPDVQSNTSVLNWTAIEPQ